MDKLISLPTSLREFNYNNFIVNCLIEQDGYILIKLYDYTFKKGEIELIENKNDFNFYDENELIHRICEKINLELQK